MAARTFLFPDARHIPYSMPQSLAQNYIHLIFSTKGRTEWINHHVQERLYPYLSKAFAGQESPAIQTGGVSDHVHILFRLSKNKPLANVIGSIKGESSIWLSETFPEIVEFSWQAGYGAFSVSASHIDSVVDYINRQAEHHRKRTFKDEFREFLEKYDVDYAERYVWD